MSTGNIHMDLDGLNELRQKAEGKVVNVGILGSTNQREGDSTNAAIGMAHEFGSGDVPQRSFLRLPLTSRKKQIVKAAGTSKAQEKMEQGDIDGVLEIIGLKAEQVIQEAFNTGGFGKWPSLSNVTIDAKGSSRQLIDTRQLARSITSKVSRKGKNA